MGITNPIFVRGEVEVDYNNSWFKKNENVNFPFLKVWLSKISVSPEKEWNLKSKVNKWKSEFIKIRRKLDQNWAFYGSWYKISIQIA